MVKIKLYCPDFTALICIADFFLWFVEKSFNESCYAGVVEWGKTRQRVNFFFL